jgi:ubiquinone/menaquinone biosynthesis C-methylase UbiE
MPRTDPFERHADRYERWFEVHEAAYRSEIRALQRLVSAPTEGVEIGVGTGRFAAPLGIQTGLDPSGRMLQQAATRGIDAVKGVAESLPFTGGAFDTAVIVTTICFVDDIEQTLREARRVLDPNGRLVIGYIDKESPVGRQYQANKAENPFYRDATFVATDELLECLERVGFAEFEFVQTIFEHPTELSEPDRVEDGRGEGSFVGLGARPI